jgi:hypothetical protein
MSSNRKFALVVVGFALALGAQSALAESVGTGAPKANAATTSSIRVDNPSAYYRPMESVGTGSPQANGATTSSYHFRPFVGIRTMESVGTGSPQAMTTSCVAPTSLWTAFACSILQ